MIVETEDIESIIDSVSVGCDNVGELQFLVTIFKDDRVPFADSQSEGINTVTAIDVRKFVVSVDARLGVGAVIPCVFQIGKSLVGRGAQGAYFPMVLDDGGVAAVTSKNSVSCDDNAASIGLGRLSGYVYAARAIDQDVIQTKTYAALVHMDEL